MSAGPISPAVRGAEQHESSHIGLGMTLSIGRPRTGLVYGDCPPNPPGPNDGGGDFLQRLAQGLVASWRRCGKY